jgi:hypothetical protein
LGASRERWIDNADVRAAEIRPVALSFQTENPLTGLPAVAGLETDDTSGLIAATVSDD